MKERPIIFSGPMVRAILEGRKTQDRRVVKPQPSVVHGVHSDASITTNLCFRLGDQRIHCPYGRPGDLLWVRETWRAFEPDRVRFGGRGAMSGLMMRVYANPPIEGESIIEYRADHPKASGWKSSAQMPRWASRITLEVTDVRVQRVQEISERDATAEGFNPITRDCKVPKFRELWDSTNAKRAPWASNPWVWAITFRELVA